MNRSTIILCAFIISLNAHTNVNAAAAGAFDCVTTLPESKDEKAQLTPEIKPPVILHLPSEYTYPINDPNISKILNDLDHTSDCLAKGHYSDKILQNSTAEKFYTIPEHEILIYEVKKDEIAKRLYFVLNKDNKRKWWATLISDKHALYLKRLHQEYRFYGLTYQRGKTTSFSVKHFD